MKNFTFRQYRRAPRGETKEPTSDDSKDRGSAAYLKRREQVRRAQRTHRERKEAYIKSLENDVLELRANETKILQEKQFLQSEIWELKKVLGNHGIAWQNYTSAAGLPGSSTRPSCSESSVSILTNPHRQKQLLRGMQQGTPNEFYLSESDGSQSVEQASSHYRRSPYYRSRGGSGSESGKEGGSSRQTPSTADIPPMSAAASNLRLKDMDQTNMGMEFVLALESPCLQHIQRSYDDAQHGPTGHALTTSAPLLYPSPTQSAPAPNHTSSNWSPNNIGLDKLLTLSDNIPLGDEVTPVQAWHQIRSHPDFENLEVGGLKRLTEDMLKHVKCYGYEESKSFVFENEFG